MLQPARLVIGALFVSLALGAAPAFAQSADLVVNQADSPDPGPAGGVFTYTIRVDNNGPDAAIGVNTSDTLPPGATFVSATSTHGSCTAPIAGVFTCALGDLAFLEHATVTLQVVLPAAGVYVNTFTATSSTPDPNSANNVNVTEDTTAVNASNMTLTVVDAPDPVAAGANYSYTVTAVNHGPAPATSQTISFPVPTGACIRSVPTGGGWSCTPSGGYPLCSGTVSCVRSTTLNNGASAPALTVPAVANIGGSITGSFTVSSPLPDGDPTDNTVTATTTVIGGSSDVQMTKTASPTTVGVGSNVTYTLTPRFNGGEPPGTLAPNVITVTDTLGAGLSFVSAAGSGWTCTYASPVVTCERPGPYTGGNFTNMPVISIVATVTAAGTVSNTARIDAPESDPVPANNQSSVNVTGSNDADLSITKTGPGYAVFPGDDFNFTLTPRNNGPAPLAIGQVVTVTDTVPAGFNIRAAPTGTGWTCSVSGAPPYPAAGPQTVTCTRTLAATFPTGNFPAITIPAETNSVGTFVNSTCVALSGAGPVDNNPANNCNGASVPSTPTGAGADLEVVSKTAAPDPVRAGENLTYVISVRNNGPVDATNVVVTDSLTSLVATGSLQSVTTSQGTCTPAAPADGATINLSCALGTLVNGGTATITVVVRPLAATSAARTNTARISSADIADPNRNNNSGSVTSQVTALVDMTLSKTDTPDPVQAGTPLTYVLTARNAGPSTASTVVVTDPLPANVAFISATASGGGTCTTPAVNDVGGTVQCTWGSIATASQQTVTIVVRPLAGATSVHNVASVTTTTEEASTTNNSATADTAVTAAAVDILVNKVDTIDPVAVGQTTGYVVTVTNAGPSYATNVTLVDTFRTGGVPTATFSYQGNLAITPPGAGTCAEPAINATTGVISCVFPGLAAGQSIRVTYDMRADGIDAGTSGTTFNQAVVAANEPETQPANNTTVHSTTSRQAADLAIVKTASAASVLPGAALTWNLNVTNNGPHSSTGAKVTDTLPAGVTFVSASPGCTFAVGVVTCTLGTLANGGSTALAINVTVNQPFNGTTPLVNSATVTTVNEIDLVPGNNTSTATTDVTPQADLAVNKTVDNGAPAVGANVTFTITAQNLGPNAAVAAQVADALPAGYALVSATPSVGSYSGGVWTIGNFANGATATLTIVATVQPTGPYLNTATISSTTQDPNPNNNTSSASTAPSVVSSLALSKTVDSPTYVPGGTGTYTVTVSNGGPSAASNVTVTDNLPAGVTLGGTVTCVPNGTANCGSVSGIAGQTAFGATGASIAAGAGNSIVFTVPVTYASSLTTNPLTNTATATAPSSPPASGSAHNTPTPRVALAVTKTDGSETYTPGGTATYMVTIRNTGPSNSTNLTVTDALPTGVTLTGAVTCAPTGVATCGTVTGGTGGTSFGTTGATLGAAAGDALVFTVPVAFAPGMTTNPLVNVATATDVPSGSTANGSDSNTLARNVSLAVTKTDGSSTYTPGGTATYTITVTNTGLSTASSVTLTDALPAGVTLTGTVTCATAGGSDCGTVVGGTGGSILGTTTAVIVPGAPNALVFTVPVAFAADLATDPLVNTATATDGPSGATGSGSDSNRRTAQVSLAVTKTDNSPTYVPGGTATYVITVTNTGTSDALNVTVQDALPPGVTLTGSATCVPNGVALCGTVTGTAGQAALGTTGAAIAAGAGNSLVFSAPVAFAANLDSNPLVNTATASDLASGATASGSDSNTLAREVALTITKTDGQETYTPGTTATYTIVVGNTGITDAVTVAVNEVLPPGVSIAGPVTCTPAGGANCGTILGGAMGSGTFGTSGSVIPAGGGNTLTFQVPVAFAAGMTTDPLVNTVSVTDKQSGASASASDSNRLATTAVSLGKTIAPATIVAGGSATLTITLGNPTPNATALSAPFVDTMPAGVTITSASNGGTCAGVLVTSTTLTLPAGSTLPAGGCTIVVAITSSTVGTVINTTGSLETRIGTAPPASAPLTVISGAVPQADLSVVKTAGAGSVAPGGTITYTIVAHNAGPSPVTGAIVSDPFASTLNNVTWTCTASPGASCPASGVGNLNAAVNLPVGGSATFTVTASVSGSASGSVSNTATITPPPGVNDPNVDNNTSTVVVPIPGTPKVDLGIVKTANGTFTAGQVGATYTIVVTNHGTIPTSGVVTVTDTVPAGLTATGISGPGWTCTQPAGPCTRSDPLAPGASYPPITLTVNVSASASGNVINVAHVQGGGDPGDDSSTVVTPIQPITPPPGPTQPIPVDSPLALLLAALALALAGGWQLRRQRVRVR